MLNSLSEYVMNNTKSPFRDQEIDKTLEESIQDLKEVVKQHPQHIEKQGIVFYTDGSARPNPGPGGWGFHGYLFAYATPTKGSGNSAVYLTNRGYVEKTEESTNALKDSKAEIEKCFTETFLVTPRKYFDGAGSFNNVVTNNVGELAGLYNALLYVQQYHPSTALLKLDNQYVLN